MGCCNSTSAVTGEDQVGLLQGEPDSNASQKNLQPDNNNKPNTRRSTRPNSFRNVDMNGDGQATHDEIQAWVKTNAAMWAMLSVNLNLSEERCIEIASRVVIELSTGAKGAEVEEGSLSKKQFRDFVKRYVDDPKGSQEFFHRSIFAHFDENANDLLDPDEFDKFLNIFYEAGSIFKGDARLPEKENLKKLVYEKLDTNKDGQFDFEEIRSLISGSALRGGL